MTSVGRCSGRCGVFCGYNTDCCKVPRYGPSHHHHHSHFTSSHCGGKGSLPSPCGLPNKQSQAGFYSGMDLYHHVMSETYQSERILKEQSRLHSLGVTGIPFSHRTSVQGNPMRSADFKSSSKYHKHCNKEE